MTELIGITDFSCETTMGDYGAYSAFGIGDSDDRDGRGVCNASTAHRRTETETE